MEITLEIIEALEHYAKHKTYTNRDVMKKVAEYHDFILPPPVPTDPSCGNCMARVFNRLNHYVDVSKERDNLQPKKQPTRKTSKAKRR